MQHTLQNTSQPEQNQDATQHTRTRMFREWARTCTHLPTHTHNPIAYQASNHTQTASKQASKRQKTRTQFLNNSNLPSQVRQSGITVCEENPFWMLALYSTQLGNYPSEQDWQNAAWDLVVKKDAAECKPQFGQLACKSMWQRFRR